MQILLFSLLVGFCCGIIGAVYRYVLAYEKILSWWFRFGNRYESKWFFKPIWGCAKCFSGQLAGWFWLGCLIIPRMVLFFELGGLKTFSGIYYAELTGALILGWFCAICAAIMTAVFFQTFLEQKA